MNINKIKSILSENGISFDILRIYDISLNGHEGYFIQLKAPTSTWAGGLQYIYTNNHLIGVPTMPEKGTAFWNILKNLDKMPVIYSKEGD